jgi:hypothetical protein
VQHLEGDGPVVLQVVGEIHRRHAPAAELALEAVAVGEGVREWGLDAVLVRWHSNNIEEGWTNVTADRSAAHGPMEKAEG